MYNSQYYTCEQIDQRLLQGYLDDYNSQNNTNLTKEQFLTLLFNTIGRNSTVDNLVTQIGYYECDTAGATAAKAITVANYALFAGGSMKVKFINKNTANNATLNINNKGAKALYYQGEIVSSTNSWYAGEVVEIYYDGTSYYANNVKGGSGSGVYDVSVEHPTAGPNGDGKFTLEYILNSSNVNELIPVNKRYPGMSIQFVSTYDNKYVQYRLISDTFNTTPANWQGVDNEPTALNNNPNVVKSSGVAKVDVSQLCYVTNAADLGELEKVNAAIKELYITGASGNLKISTFRTLSPNTCRIVFDDSNGNSVAKIEFSTNQWGKVVNIVEVASSGVTGYAIVEYKEDVNWSGTHFWLYSNKLNNIIYSPIIQSTINDNEIKSELLSVEDKLYKNTVGNYIANPSVSYYNVFNSSVKELYIEGLASTDVVRVSTFKMQSGDCRIVLLLNGTAFAKCYIKYTPTEDIVYPLTMLTGYEQYRGYIVWKYVSNVNVTSANDILSDKINNQTFCPLITNYLIGIKNFNYKWTSYDNVNSRIKEFYIPTINNTGDFYLKEFTVTSERFFVKLENSTGTKTILAIATFESEDFYQYNPITPLYLAVDGSRNVIGYIMLRYTGEDLDLRGISYSTDNSLLESGLYSPTIYETQNSDEQIVLIGDSLFGNNLHQESRDQETHGNNVLADILMGITHKQVLNCGFGGCSMAHRHQNPSYDADYDKFSFYDVMNTLITQNFSPMESVTTSIYNQYKKQISFLKKVDFSKKVIILVSYLGNDVAPDVKTPIGNEWEMGQNQENWDIYSYLGAMNAGIDRLFAGDETHIGHPLVNLVFITGNYKIRYVKTSTNPDVYTPYAPYQYVVDTATGATWLDYYQGLIDNAKRIGVGIGDMYNGWGVKNAYNAYDKITVDGSHFNTYGYSMFAKWLRNLVEKYIVL